MATSFKTRKALGRRYGIDPAILLEMERLNQEYQLAPGREARGMQAAQFAESMAFNRSEAEKNRREREEANRQAAKGSMAGTVSNLATTGLTLRAMTKEKGEPFFGDWSSAKNKPADVSITSQTPEQIQQSGGDYGNTAAATGLTGTQVSAPTSGLPVHGPPTAPTGTYTVSPATIDSAGAGLGLSGGAGASEAAVAGAEGFVPGAAVGETAGGVVTPLLGETVGGIVGGVTTAMPYYAAARIGGSLLTAMHPKEMSTTTAGGYMHTLGKSLESPMNVERTWGQALGIEDDDSTTINIIHDIINPLGYVERQAGTVICTELYRQGLMSDETYEADKAFGKKQDIETIRGYHLWAIPLANLIRNSKLVTWIIKPIAMAWAENMAGKPNRFGAFLNKIGIPICRFIGRKVLEVAHG